MYKKFILTTALGLVIFAGDSLAETTGSCGTNCTYTMDDAGNVVITGTGTFTGLSKTDTSKVKTAIVGEGITEIGSSAFAGANSLSNVQLPETLETIKSAAFSYNSSLKDITIPSSVSEIEKGAFDNNGGRNVNILGNNVSLDPKSFTGNNYVSIGGSVTWSCGTDCVATLDNEGKAIFNGTGTITGMAGGLAGAVKTAIVGEGITEIGSSAFAGANSLSNVQLPETLETIKSAAFSYNNNNSSIILPPGLQNIEPFWDNYTKNLFYYSDEQKEALNALGFSNSKLTPYIINDDGKVYYTDKEGYDIRFENYTNFTIGNVLEKYKKGADGRTYVYSPTNELLSSFEKNSDGSTYVYDAEGNIKEIHGKKIYTVEEAMAVTRDGNVNRVRLTYK